MVPSSDVGKLRKYFSALIFFFNLTSKCQITFSVLFAIRIILNTVDVITGKRGCPRNAAHVTSWPSKRTHVVHSSEGHAKAASPWFSQARGHSQFNVLAVTLNDWRVACALFHAVRLSLVFFCVFFENRWLKVVQAECVKRCADEVGK